jgi:hypothetical protein
MNNYPQEPGFYWCYLKDRKQWTVVEIENWYNKRLIINFIGNDDIIYLKQVEDIIIGDRIEPPDNIKVWDNE